MANSSTPWNTTIRFVLPGRGSVVVHEDYLPMPDGFDESEEKWRAWLHYEERVYERAYAKYRGRAFDGDRPHPVAHAFLGSLRIYHEEEVVAKYRELSLRAGAAMKGPYRYELEGTTVQYGSEEEHQELYRESLGHKAADFIWHKQVLEAANRLLDEVDRWEPPVNDERFTETQKDYLRTALDISNNGRDYPNASRWLDTIGRRYGNTGNAVQNSFRSCGLLPEGGWRTTRYRELKREIERIARELQESGRL